MARHARNARPYRQPVAIAATRSLPRDHRLAMAGMACAVLAASFVSPLLALGLVGLMLLRAHGDR